MSQGLCREAGSAIHCFALAAFLHFDLSLYDSLTLSSYCPIKPVSSGLSNKDFVRLALIGPRDRCLTSRLVPEEAVLWWLLLMRKAVQ